LKGRVPAAVAAFLATTIAAFLATASGQASAQVATPRTKASSPGAPRPVRTPKPGLISNGGTLNSFSQAIYARLDTDVDYGKFVDPQVQGDDRRLAIKLLKLMPVNKRGDFTYVSGMKVLSNRVELARNLLFLPKGDRRLPPDSASARARRQFSYPPAGGSGGPYIRHYSTQGANAAIGYASVPCNSNLGYLDNGFMYFNSYTSTSSGSIMDAGLEVNSNLQANAFINLGSYGGYLYHGWTNLNYRWNCGTPIGMLYGSIYGTGTSVLIIGLPDYDPTRVELPPDSITWHQAAWNFFQTPSPLMTSPGLWNGISSNCTQCSVAKMYTISPANNPVDRSCFGLCNGAATGPWDQVEMGELIQPCNQNPQSAQCTIEYLSGGAWYGGFDTGAGGSAASVQTMYSTDSPIYALEGIALGGSSGAQAVRAPAGTFVPLAAYPSNPQTACEAAAAQAGFGPVPIDSASNQPQPEYVVSQGYLSGSWVLAESQSPSNTDSGLPYTYGPPVCYI
jgi:hypothetical protein